MVDAGNAEQASHRLYHQAQVSHGDADTARRLGHQAQGWAADAHHAGDGRAAQHHQGTANIHFANANILEQHADTHAQNGHAAKLRANQLYHHASNLYGR